MVPGATLVTNPLLLMVAVAGSDETHALEAAGGLEALNCVLSPIHKPRSPLMTGNGRTVIVCVAGQPRSLM